MEIFTLHHCEFEPQLWWLNFLHYHRLLWLFQGRLFAHLCVLNTVSAEANTSVCSEFSVCSDYSSCRPPEVT